jgi:hypothetical protein
MSRPRFAIGSALLLLGLWLALPTVAQTLNGFDLRGALVPPSAIQRGGPPRDGIPAIDSPRFVSAAQSGLGDKDRVLGIDRGGGDARLPGAHPQLA